MTAPVSRVTQREGSRSGTHDRMTQRDSPALDEDASVAGDKVRDGAGERAEDRGEATVDRRILLLGAAGTKSIRCDWPAFPG